MKIPSCRWLLPIGHLIVDTFGNLPAAVTWRAFRPEHPISWVAMYESGAVLIWFLIGHGIDARRFRLRREMLVYLGARAVVAALIGLYGGIGRTGAQLEMLFWFALAIWSAGWLVMRVVNRARAA